MIQEIMFIPLILSLVYEVSSACECGISGTNRVINGREISAHKYPWLVHLKIVHSSGKFYLQCGGTIMDRYTILTAAHCLFFENDRVKSSLVRVYLGYHDITKASDFEEIQSFHIPKVYSPEDNAIENDFAFLKLKKPLKFSKHVSPICMSNAESTNVRYVVVGWGSRGKDVAKSQKPYEAVVDYVNRTECNETKRKYFLSHDPSYPVKEIAATVMCAVNRGNKAGACFGDSGGPLMHKSPMGRWHIDGIVSGSWGACFESNTVGLYTKLSLFRNVIRRFAPDVCYRL